jgi:homoserine O-acetyltransferase
MIRSILRVAAVAMALLCATAGEALARGTAPAPVEGDYVVRDFRFRSGETLDELRLHYTTIGQPRRDSRGGSPTL